MTQLKAEFWPARNDTTKRGKVEIFENNELIMVAHAHKDHSNQIVFDEHTLLSKPLSLDILDGEDLPEIVPGLNDATQSKTIILIKRGNKVIKQIAVGIEYKEDGYNHEPSLVIKDLDVEA